MSIIPERLSALRKVMEKKGIDYYVVPTADYHQSEYVGEHFKEREYITGFNGSAGTAVIGMKEACLWTDGRYFIAAAAQLKDTTVKLMKMGEPGVPEITEYLEKNLKPGETLGFDGRAVSIGEGDEYAHIAENCGAKINYEEDLIDEIWENRPELSKEPVFALGMEYAGESVESKLGRIREEMKAAGANVHALTTIDDICWTLNIRGNDIEFFPLVLSYALITMDSYELYIDESKLSDEIKKDLAKDGIKLHPYNDIYSDICNLKSSDVILVDPQKLNYALFKNIPADVKKVERRNPAILMKAIKNDVEIANIRKAELKDSVAHLRYMKWLKENYNKMKITELVAEAKLDEFRAELGNFIRPSFAPISSYGEHAAIVHYESSPETDVQLKEGNFFLSDTGAGFYEGSTDITRTFALGEVPDFMKDHFTLVAISNLSLANAKFLEGTTGMVLDILSRKPFWDRNLNFNHGTGHGVGYLLNIHEGPTGFRWKYRKGETEQFHEGMVITDEPGIYIEGSHGIRLENEILCRKGELNEYGQFMYFEPLTFVPFDLDAINPDLMTKEQKKMLNDYHAQVYANIAPLLENDDEKEFLKKYTRAI
ncbi:MAG: aminopeptidase P family N-terminal domain-containing protein [Lachnospiraceae bacterium]|nr:aminopeptidase P family N-terminal domain-containing protein [Lachnospiraceae bacterium]